MDQGQGRGRRLDPRLLPAERGESGRVPRGDGADGSFCRHWKERGVKITDVRTAEIKGHGYSTYVRIYTDEGLIGNGECIHGGEGCPEMVHALKQHIIGE